MYALYDVYFTKSYQFLCTTPRLSIYKVSTGARVNDAMGMHSQRRARAQGQGKYRKGWGSTNAIVTNAMTEGRSIVRRDGTWTCNLHEYLEDT